jgi:myosin-1
MTVCGIDQRTQMDLFQIVAGILHLGNIDFVEEGANSAVKDPNCKFFGCTLFCFIAK